jgi:acyl-[acyl-carrier-protein]-phospholipid O-acyltransferase/long-chain-fatty-acid--[acyl-carrier-protein] ligase
MNKSAGHPARLLLDRRFWPLFWAQFTGAVNDNLLKNAYVILIAYRETQSAGATEIIVTLAAAIFILPYFLLSATAGDLSDKYAKSWLLQRVKLTEIGVVALGALSFALDSIAFQLFVLFLLGVQATFFGPIKYALLPELLKRGDLVDGNALIEAGTFLGILSGTIAGGLLILLPGGAAWTSAALLVLSLGGFGASLMLPATRPAAPRLQVQWNIAALTWEIIGQAHEKRKVWLAVLGISWFWLVGAALLSQFPNFAKEYLQAGNQVVTLFLTLNSIGVGLGSLLVSRMFKGRISADLVPWSALGMAICFADLWWNGGGSGTPAHYMDAVEFLSYPAHWRVLADLFVLAVCAGIYIVPLYVIMQAESDRGSRSRVVAANNILNALFIVIAGAGSALMLKLGSGVPAIFLAVGLLNTALAAAILIKTRR